MVNLINKTFAACCVASTIAAFAPAICNAATLPECPQTIVASQTVQITPEGWNALPYSGPQRLMRITFKLRPDSGELPPDEEKEKGGKQILVWDVKGLKELEQICEYSGTLARLTRPVTGIVTRCEVQEIRSAGSPVRFSGGCH